MMTRKQLLPLVLFAASALQASLPAQTILSIGPETLRTGVSRFGINLSGQNYYDSGQMSRNLVVRNPGFEAEMWQSILRCKAATATTCTDQNPYSTWPANFLQGASAETVTGQRGTVTGSSAADGKQGVTLTLAGLPGPLAAGDFLILRVGKPGSPEAGWWPSVSGAASFAPETSDLSPETTGHQAIRIDALASGASASLKSYFDSLAGHSFVQLRAPYQLHFRAKPLAGRASVSVSLLRQGSSHTLTSFINQDVSLKPGWNDYTLTTEAVDIGNPVGTVALGFNVAGSTILLDDVALFPYNSSPGNSTAFRDEVVQALRTLHPGYLRYMDNGASFGSTLDNLLADAFSRQRSGYSTQQTLQEDIPIGLTDFLVLCQAVGADPWITLPPTLSRTDAVRLIQYLSGPNNLSKMRVRVPPGAGVNTQPWSAVFKTIHLELGNEQWNNRSFSGGTFNDPAAYAARAGYIFGAMRATPGFVPAHYDLIMGSWSAVPWWTQQQLQGAKGVADTVAIAPYLFSSFNDASSPEAVFGSMFAEPEQWDSHAGGQVAQQLAAARSASFPAKLAVYEVNLGTAEGSASQAAIDSTVPSLGGALAVADHMLLMLRDLGITTQSLFALPEYSNAFAGSKSTPLWGAVVDMGGSTDLRRPTYLALQAINAAMLPNLIATHLQNAPTWHQAASKNDSIPAGTEQVLQTFAFADGPKRSLIVMNLSRTAAEAIRFAGPNAPTGTVQQTTLTAPVITASNEKSEQVRATSATLQGPTSLNLPPFSMTTLSWTAN